MRVPGLCRCPGVFGEVPAESCVYLGQQVGGGRPEAAGSLGGTNRHDEVDCLVEGRAGHEFEVAAGERDVREAGVDEDVARRIRARHGERTGAAGGLVVLLRLLDHALDDLLGPEDPEVVLAAAPDDHRQLAARNQSDLHTFRSAATGLMKNIVPMRENAMSYGPPSVIGLHVGDEEARVLHARFLGLGARHLEKRSAASTPTASPLAPTIPAIRCVVSPRPQPMSSTRWPGWGGTSERRVTVSARPVVKMWRKRSQASNSGPSQA